MEKKTGKKKKKSNKLTPRMQASLALVYGVFALVAIILIVRLAFLANTEKYEKKALAQHSYVSSVIPYKRGDITDRNGQVIAGSNITYNLVLDARLLNQPLYAKYIDATVKALTEVFELDEAELRNTLTEKKNSAYVVLKKDLSYDEKKEYTDYVAKLEKDAAKIAGVWFEEGYKRIYPFETTASHIIGFTMTGDVGTYGIEQKYNEELTGMNGRTYGYYDSSLNIQKTVKEAEHGNQIVSTIDINVQRVAERYVEQFLEETGAENVGVIMMDADNGEILAMQSNYSYDLNAPRDLTAFYTEEELSTMTESDRLNALYDIWRNFCISDAFEPGSTFKPFTIAAGLEEHVITGDSEFICDGKEHFGETIDIKCSNKWGHGRLSLVQTLMVSCNDALMQIAAMEGNELFHFYQKHFLMGCKTGIDIPGETAGNIFSVEELNQTELATSSFGQSFTVNMMQMVAGFASLINGGTYYEPHVVKAIKTAEGATIRNIEPIEVEKTVSRETSDFIREAMYLTVTDGTAKKAQVEGYVIGGKTGTAQKYPREEGKNLVSFLGFAEAAGKTVVIYVVVDEAHDPEKMSKSATASTLAADILQDALPYLRMYPEGEIKYYLEAVELEDILFDEINNPDYLPENDEGATDILPGENQAPTTVPDEVG